MIAKKIAEGIWTERWGIPMWIHQVSVLWGITIILFMLSGFRINRFGKLGLVTFSIMVVMSGVSLYFKRFLEEKE